MLSKCIFGEMASATYPIGAKRVVKLRKDYIVMEDTESKKYILLSFQKWKRLCGSIIEIDESVNDVLEKKNNVALKVHIGGGWFVSVTSGISCVDIRKFFKLDGNQVLAPYLNTDDDLKPTRIGLALKFPEWQQLKTNVRDSIDSIRPDIKNLQLCYLSADHQNQEGKYKAVFFYL
jgi:hypothetical protein